MTDTAAPQVLMWSSYSPITFNAVGGYGNTYTAMLDLASGAVTEVNVANTQHDMFCPGAGGWHLLSQS